MDKMTKKQRSFCMSRIKAENTSPEIKLRKAIWNMGYKGYRIHCGIPGKPDIAFVKKRLAIFVDGCFWHKCPTCFKKPKTNTRYWSNKIEYNVNRDIRINNELYNLGIKVIRLREHDIVNNLSECLKVIRNNYEIKKD